MLFRSLGEAAPSVTGEESPAGEEDADEGAEDELEGGVEADVEELGHGLGRGAGVSDVLDGAGGDGVEEDASVGAVGDAAVEDDDDAGVGAGADESSEALAELEDGFRDGVFDEVVSSLCACAFGACLDERVVGDGEGELGDDDVGEGVSGDVDASPEGGGAEDDGAWRALELLDQIGRASWERV